MSMHLNFGGGKNGGGVGVYKVLDAKGEETPIGWQYDTRKDGETGFTLPDIEPVMTWDQLREIWPIWKSRQKQEEEVDLTILDD